MKFRILFSVIALLSMAVYAGFNAPATRYAWLAFTFLSFLGIFVFDGLYEIVSNWLNTTIFLAVYGLMLHGIVEQVSESFWHDCAAAVFFIALAFEVNSEPWSGKARVRTTLIPAVLFFLLVLAQCMPALLPEAVVGISLGALLLLSFFEGFYFFRECSEKNSGSYMAAIRLAVSGLICLFYCNTFLPEVSRQKTFSFMFYALPAAGILISMVALFHKEVNKRYILFCGTWSLFVFWAAFTGEPNRIFAGLAATMIGSWAVMMTRNKMQGASTPSQAFVRLSGWALPGSLIFMPMIFILAPSEKVDIQNGTALWLATIIVFWISLGRLNWDKPKETKLPENWRDNLAVAVTLVGAGFWAALKVFPVLLVLVWGP